MPPKVFPHVKIGHPSGDIGAIAGISLVWDK